MGGLPHAGYCHSASHFSCGFEDRDCARRADFVRHQFQGMCIETGAENRHLSIYIFPC